MAQPLQKIVGRGHSNKRHPLLHSARN